jgi:1-acyl-sn-glycerol-3-phosphate acyltransferase
MKSDDVIKICPEEVMKPASELWWDLYVKGILKKIIVRFKVHQEAEGAENLTTAVESGRPVFAFSNHVSWADHFLIMIMIDDILQVPVSALAKEKYFKYPFFGWTLRKGNQIPITNVKLCYTRWFKQTHGRLPRQSEFIDFMTKEGANIYHEANVLKRQSLVRTAIYTHEMLQRKRMILGYPEGTRSQKSSMQPIKTGIMQLPFECKGLVLPSAISGTDKILPHGIKWYNIFKYYGVQGGSAKVRFSQGICYTELLDRCQEKFERINDMVNLENVKTLREQIENGTFRAYTLEAERFERIFDESSLIIMRAVNKILPPEYKTDQVEIKYPR